jgi:death-on-curing protein
MTIYLSTDDIQRFNERFVGPGQLRDFGLLDSATNRPQATVLGEDAYPTVHEKAAAMLHSLARNHPFIDGNKRTAWAAASVFYEINGFEINVDDGLIIGLVVDVAEGLKGVQDIAQTVKAWAQPFPIDDDWMGA